MARRSKPTETDLTAPVLTALQNSPGVLSPVLAATVGSDTASVRAVLLKLEQNGRARREGQTKATRWFPVGQPAPVQAKASAQQEQAPMARPAPLAAPAKAAPAKASTTVAEAREGKRPSPKTDALDRVRDEIGTVLDSVIAERTGVSSELVRLYRKRHGIPGVQDRGILQPRTRAAAKEPAPAAAKESAPAAAKEPAPAPVPSRAATEARQSSLWKVHLQSGETKYVVGPGLAEAAANAVARVGTAAIIEIERVGTLVD